MNIHCVLRMVNNKCNNNCNIYKEDYTLILHNKQLSTTTNNNCTK